MELHVAANRPHLVGLFEQFTYDVPDGRLAPVAVIQHRRDATH
jgi:hypothetical protein